MRDKLDQLIEDQRSRYFLWSPVLFGAGAGIYFALPFEPHLPIGVSATSLVVCVCLSLQFLSGIFRVSALAVCMLAAGLFWASVRTVSVTAPVLPKPFIGTAEGRVVKIDRSQTNRLRITLDRVILYGNPADETPARVRLTLPSKSADATIADRVMVFGRLEAPGMPVEPGGFDFRKWAWFERLGGVGYALGPDR